MKTLSVKRNGTRLAIVLLIGIFLIPALASAGHGRHGKGGEGYRMGRGGGPWSVLSIWQKPEAVEKLGLTEEQVARLKEADFASRERALDIRSRMESLELEMEKALSADVLNETQVRELAKKMSDVRGEMFMERVENRLTARKILTSEQVEKIKAMFNDRREKRGGFGKHRGPGGGPGVYGKKADM